MLALRTLRHAILAAPVFASCATVGQLNIISEEQEIQMGAEFSQQLEQELDFVTDPVVVGYVERLGQSLARVSQRSDLPYTFQVVDSDEVNAFAVPGGHLYVNRGLIEAAESESELAGVLGHEIGHIVGRHSARQLTQQYGIGILASLALGEDPGMLSQIAAQIAATGAITSYSRAMESEADAYGVQELHDAGINPAGLATFFDKLEAMRQGGSSGVEQFFSTHPDPGARAESVRAMIAQLPPRSYRSDSPEFQEAKRRASR